MLSDTASVRPSGLTATCGRRVGRHSIRRHHGRAAEQGGEQGSLGLRGAIERHRLAGQKRRHVEPGFAQRLRPQLAAERGACLGDRQLRVARCLPLADHRHHAGHHGEDQQHGRAEQQPAQAPVLHALAVRLALGFDPARADELALEVVHPVAMLGGELERRGKPRAAVELARVAPARVPFRAATAQVRM